MKIRTVDGPSEELSKRCYLPLEIYDECPKCGNTIESWNTVDYFSYPRFGVPERVSFSCHDCDEEWSKYVMLSISAKEVEKEG